MSRVKVDPRNVQQMLDCSLTYLDPESRVFLNEPTDLFVIPFIYGWIIYAPEDEFDDEDEHDPVPYRLRRLLNFVRMNGWEWLKLDDDGPTHDGLDGYLSRQSPAAVIKSRLQKGD